MGTHTRGTWGSTALEASHIITPSGAVSVGSIGGRLDATAPSNTYYVQVLACVAGAVPADGAVTHVLPPGKIVHTNGSDNYFDFLDVIPAGGITCSQGICVVLSTTEFTKTIAGAYLSVGGAA